jgi:pimeloyl-ACP methyl ester carboxylesterase
VKRRNVHAGGTDLAVFCLDGDSPAGAPEVIWAHGWGQTHQALLPLAQAMRRSTRSTLLDLPGFGASPEPPAAWSTADYADAAAEWLAAIRAPSPASGGGLGWGSGASAIGDDGLLRHPHPNPPPQAGEGKADAAVLRDTATVRRVWIGHSFGGRVGLQLAARHPDTLDALCLIATPGLPPMRSPAWRGRIAARRLMFRLARSLTPEGPARDRLRSRFGSSDYARATPLLRQVLVKAVNEDLGDVARAVGMPVLLAYGDRDQDTPLDIGRRLEQLIPQSRLIVLRGFGHLDILTDGQHQLVQRLGEFLEQVG